MGLMSRVEKRRVGMTSLIYALVHPYLPSSTFRLLPRLRNEARRGKGEDGREAEAGVLVLTYAGTEAHREAQ
jgi:hypothetical protein